MLERVEIPFIIYDSDITYYGGSQSWFLKELHKLSGCGPVAAANITAYLSLAFPDKFYSLYPYKDTIRKNDFVPHMIEVRKFVKPGAFGLTSVHQFSNQTLEFARHRGVSLNSNILDDHTSGLDKALSFIYPALSQKLPVAILVLKHPAKELAEYTWHWMTITGLRPDSNNHTFYISVSTFGERREIDFNLLWNNRKGPQDIVKLVYFY